MIREKTIKFGYGTIAVLGNSTLRTLVLDYIEPPVEIGSSITSEYNPIQRIKFNYDHKSRDMNDLYNNLNFVSAENPIVEFRGYQFDFSEFNPTSLQTLKSAVKNVLTGNLMLLAC